MQRTESFYAKRTMLTFAKQIPKLPASLFHTVGFGASEWHLTPNRGIVRRAGRFNSRRRGSDFEKFLPAAVARAGPMRQTNTHPAAVPNKKKLMHCVT
jgi:hypothetical protein